MALQVNRVSEGRRVVAQALCPDALDRMLARDRRAELVDTSAWIELTSGTTSTFQAPSTCEWMLAVRAQGSESSTVTLDTRPVASRAVRERSPLIAVSVDAITVDGALAHADVDLWVRAEDERVRVARARHPSEPHLFLVHAGAKLVVEVTRRGESAVLSKASLPLADGEHTVVLADQEGNQGAARVHARLFPEPRFDDGELRP
jgi:hypothetical protein